MVCTFFIGQSNDTTGIIEINRITITLADGIFDLSNVFPESIKRLVGDRGS